MDILHISLKSSPVTVVIESGEYSRKVDFAGSRIQLHLPSSEGSRIEIGGEVFNYNPQSSVASLRNFNSQAGSRVCLGVVQKVKSDEMEFFWEAEGFKKKRVSKKKKVEAPVEVSLEEAPEMEVEKASIEVEGDQDSPKK